MPIFNDDLDPLDKHQQPYAGTDALPIGSPPRKYRRLSEESIRTEFCEGPVPDSPPQRSDPSDAEDGTATSDRAELIERLKRGESPTWVPNRHLESLYHQENCPVTPTRKPASPNRGNPPSLLPPADLTLEKQRPLSPGEERARDGLEIERPRSALHRGDFSHEESPETREIPSGPRQRIEPQLMPSDPWFATSPPRHFTPFALERRSQRQSSSLCSSFSSSFAYQPPTTPLVQSESNEDLDVLASSVEDDLNLRLPRFTSPRRNTTAASYDPPSSFVFPARHTPSRASLRRDGSLPYQAHQPRRSLTNIPSLPRSASSPQSTALLRSRRTSFGSESSPLHHASMVGSYEESILRGRMSTTPSKPLDFVAQIGVLGKGDCKPALRCPQHVTLPFPAVYYSYSSTVHSRTGGEDGPSPYVGQIDLENGLPDPEELSRARRRAKAEARAVSDDVEMIDADQPPQAKPSRRSRASRAPPGGSYRIPEKGQIQIIIKNQNKTAVKLFLIPYDLTGMGAGTKTFVRQKSYSAGPIIDGIRQSSSHTDPLERPTLRYLVHLHVCCPSKGRYYLYKSIRIVFANRVPDGKENLRNETTWPEPKFSPYKPVRLMKQPLSASGPGAILTSEKAYRRRSLGIHGPSASFSGYESMPTHPSPMHQHAGGDAEYVGSSAGVRPVDAIPFRLPSRHSDVSESTTTIRSPSRPSTMGSATTDGSSPANGSGAHQKQQQHQGVEKWEKLKKGDAGYGGNVWASAAASAAAAATEGWKGVKEEGLLSRQLQSLGVGRGADEGADYDHYIRRRE